MPTIASLKHEIDLLEAEIAGVKKRCELLADKLDVVEEHTCENYNMIKELNTWKNEVDNRLDQEL